MKRTYFALVCLLLTAFFCHAQSGPPSQPPVQAQPNPPAQQPSSAGQQAPPAADPPASQPVQPASQGKSDQAQNKDPQAATDQPLQSGTSKDRLFFALPNFLTLENANNVPPLTTGQKYKVVAKGSFDPIQIVWYGALSALSQAEDSEPGFGQGWTAYGKRYGAYAADGTIENFFVGAIFPSILSQDPRYFQKGQGSFFNRSGYAISRIFWTRTDSGQGQFNYSEIAGAAVAATISTYSYHPHPGYHPIEGQNVPYIPSDRTWKNTASVWGSQVGYDTVTLVIKEFWPDVRRWIRKQPNPAALNQTGQ